MDFFSRLVLPGKIGDFFPIFLVGEVNGIWTIGVLVRRNPYSSGESRGNSFSSFSLFFELKKSMGYEASVGEHTKHTFLGFKTRLFHLIQ